MIIVCAVIIVDFITIITFLILRFVHLFFIVILLLIFFKFLVIVEDNNSPSLLTRLLLGLTAFWILKNGQKCQYYRKKKYVYFELFVGDSTVVRSR